MKSEFQIDFKSRTMFIERIVENHRIDTIRNKIQIFNEVKKFQIFRKIREFSISKKCVLINLIKIVGQDWFYYSEIEYIPEYRAYEIFNQII